MKATARAHPIQGLVKYHGLRDAELRYPYHDSISVATAPAETITTVEFDPELDESTYVVDGEELTGEAAARVQRVLDRVRAIADDPAVEVPVKLVSENSMPTNVGLGSSSSGFAAAAMAAVEAAGLDLTRPEISTIARRGSASAARSVTGGFSDLRAGTTDEDCRSSRIESSLEDDLRIVVGIVPAYKETGWAHEEATQSHLWQSRLAHVHDQLAAMRQALREGDFETAFEVTERDTLSLAATTMTGPEAWIYWQPETLEIFETVRGLRDEGVPVYFSTDTGATVYVNTRAEHVAQVEAAIADLGVETRVWEAGGPATVLPETEALF
ncbi:phosphomevalonate decarboxylase MvaD [Halodesulfurarchaeum sp. HSR-GB]|uniref:phosphomevalonate decarboxylase MvaD n=1 Tax=Halodesulfurarchaeum sp. HSR-GB TaxID=3074077 RepID=UPI002854E946|nr:phosphomevalonate decarboxylase MvaD [Halodesulfurarchaeum sp. HSR-GB]MDR5657181.1 phosphomevalonate decarboxylase MvaD [Halodesulfurarchaeum sp. HSR-GB]